MKREGNKYETRVIVIRYDMTCDMTCDMTDLNERVSEGPTGVIDKFWRAYTPKPSDEPLTSIAVTMTRADVSAPNK